MNTFFNLIKTSKEYACRTAKGFITIYRYENVQSPSGQITKDKKVVATVRTYRLKSNGSNKEVAKELFDTLRIIFQIRYNPEIQDSDFIEYNGNEFKITFVDNNIWDRTMKLTAEKINSIKYLVYECK